MYKRILIITSSLGGGGAERIAVDVANGFSELGDEVVLFALRPEGQYKTLLNKKVVVKSGHGNRAATNVWMLMALFIKYSPEIIFCSQNYLCFFVWLAKVVTFSSSSSLFVRESSTPSESIPRTFKGRVLKICTKCVYERADHVIATCEYVRDDMVHFYKLRKKPLVMNNPVNTELIRAQSLDSISLSYVNDWLHNDIPIIISIGRLHSVKNFDFLIRSFELLFKVKECRLLILGEGDERGKLEAIIEEKLLTNVVKLPGFMANPFPFLRCSSVLALTSLFEGYPNVLIQARIVGTPIASVKCPGGVAEMLADEDFVERHNEVDFSALLLSKLDIERGVDQASFVGVNVVEFVQRLKSIS